MRKRGERSTKNREKQGKRGEVAVPEERVSIEVGDASKRGDAGGGKKGGLRGGETKDSLSRLRREKASLAQGK